MTANRVAHDESGVRYRVVCACGMASHERGCHEVVARDWAREHAEVCLDAAGGGIELRPQNA